MWKKDLDKVKELHSKYNFQGPLLDAGGLPHPCIADYEISKEKAYYETVFLENRARNVIIPHEDQQDRYVNISYPWSFIEKEYTIENPELGGLLMEDLPSKYENAFNTIIIVSVLEHVKNPYKCIEQVHKCVKPGGYVFNSVPFMFPYHDKVDNWRFSPDALKDIFEEAGFEWLEGDFHIKYETNEGIGDYHNSDKPQGIIGCYCLCQKK